MGMRKTASLVTYFYKSVFYFDIQTKANNKISDSAIKGKKEGIPIFLDAANCFSENGRREDMSTLSCNI